MMDAFNRRDLDSFLALVTADGRYEDRRKGLRDEGPIRPDFARALFIEAAPSWQEETEPVAIRGPRLVLCRLMFRDHSEVDRPIAVEALVLIEVTDDELTSRLVIFDPDDIDGAMAELTARWIASGEVAHPEVIETARRLSETVNRHDWEAFASTQRRSHVRQSPAAVQSGRPNDRRPHAIDSNDGIAGTRLLGRTRRRF